MFANRSRFGQEAAVAIRAARRALRKAAIVSLALVPLAAPAQEEADPRLLAAYALSLRAEGVAGGAAAGAVLASIPGAAAVGGEDSLALLWRPFFANAIIELGRLRSPSPVALYYNPLLDVALLSLWEEREGGWRLASVHALPGERLADSAAGFALAPPWMGAPGGPLDGLVRIAGERLAAFRDSHPATAAAGAVPAAFASAAADMRAALPRLLWNATQAAQWTDGSLPWLEAALAGVERALAASTAAAATEAAPETDADTAAALVGLPPAFAENLGLDAVLEAGADGRLLFASLPDDGDVYVVAYCRLDGAVCAPRRLALLSVLE